MTRPSVRLGALLAAAELDAAKVVVDDRAADGPVADDPMVNDPMVNDLVIASGEVTPGALFGCVPGSRADGHDYASDAVKRGAVALLSERPVGVGVRGVPGLAAAGGYTDLARILV